MPTAKRIDHIVSSSIERNTIFRSKKFDNSHISGTYVLHYSRVVDVIIGMISFLVDIIPVLLNADGDHERQNGCLLLVACGVDWMVHDS